MDSRIVITGIAGFDGEYEFDPSWFTNEELRTIKRMAGVRAGELADAYLAGDNDLLVAWAALALARNGKVVHEGSLWKAKIGAITFVEGDAEEAEALPPEKRPESDESASVKSELSGPDSESDSANPQNGQSRTGLQPSELSAA